MMIINHQVVNLLLTSTPSLPHPTAAVATAVWQVMKSTECSQQYRDWLGIELYEEVIRPLCRRLKQLDLHHTGAGAAVVEGEEGARKVGCCVVRDALHCVISLAVVVSSGTILCDTCLYPVAWVL